MPDLNATMFFKTKFSVSAVNPGEDLLWKTILHLREWQVRKCRRRGLSLPRDYPEWTKLKRGGKMTVSDSSITFFSEYFCPDDNTKQCWACRIIENIPRSGDLIHLANRRWITEIGYEQIEADTALLSFVVSYSDRAGFIGPYQSEPDPSIPNIILNIIDDSSLKVFCGIDELKREPQKLVVGDWPDFFERLKNGDRQLPYILVSPQAQVEANEHQTMTFLVDYRDLAKKLFGNAVVFFYADQDFEQEMSYLNEDYSCYGGAIRVYQPGVQEAYRHRYLSANDIFEFGDKNVSKFLFRAFAQNCDFYESFFCIEECLRRKAEFTHKARLAQLHQTYETRLSEAEENGLTLAEQEEEKRLQAEIDIENLKRQLTDERERNHSLEVQVDLFRGAAEENSGLRQAMDARNKLAEMPKNIEDVVTYFRRTFSDKIVFSDDAVKSLKDCTIPPNELWSDLFALACTMCELYKNGTGDIFKTFQEQTGKNAKRGEGAETRKDKALMRQYTTMVDGEDIDIEAHLTYAKLGQSIHFGYSEKLGKLVIGHCGEHLNNYSTRKAK